MKCLVQNVPRSSQNCDSATLVSCTWLYNIQYILYTTRTPAHVVSVIKVGLGVCAYAHGGGACTASLWLQHVRLLANSKLYFTVSSKGKHTSIKITLKSDTLKHSFPFKLRPLPTTMLEWWRHDQAKAIFQPKMFNIYLKVAPTQREVQLFKKK